MSKLTIYTDDMKLVIDCGNTVEANQEFLAIRNNLLGLDEQPKKKLFGKKPERKVLPNIVYYGRNNASSNMVHTAPVMKQEYATGGINPTPTSGGTGGNSNDVVTTPVSLDPPKVIAKSLPPTPQTLQKLYGFMYIRCQHCGELRGFYIKPENATTECTCRNCNKTTPLVGLRKLVAQCTKCGKRFIYKTNLDPKEAPFDKECLECGAPVPIKYNAHEDCFDTMI